MRYMIVFVAALTVAVAAIAGPVPVQNGDFEQGLEGWNTLKPGGFAEGTVRLETGDVHSGKNAVRISNPAGAEKALVGLIGAAPIALPDDKRTFALTAWMKVITPPQAVELRVASTDKQGKALVPWQDHGWKFLRPPLEPHRGQWHKLRVEFGAQPHWGGFQLTYWVSGAGAEVIVDDLRLEAVNPTDWSIKSVGRRLPDPAPAVALWWESPQVKVLPGDSAPAATGTALQLTAAGGEYDCVQLCLRPGQAIADATVTFSDLKGPQTLPASVLRANFVGLVEVKQALTGRSMLGMIPDPLLPDPKLTLPAGQSTAIWLTLKLPRGTPAGQYHGTVTVSGQGLQARVPLSVRAYGFDLPQQPALRTMARIWQKHEGYEELFRQNLQEHRCGGTSYLGGIKATPVPGAETVTLDFSGLKAALDQNLRRFDFTVFNVPAIFLGDASGLYNKQGKWYGFEVFSPAFDKAFTDYCRRIAEALQAEGVLQHAIWQIWDEPQNRQMKDHCIHLAKLVRQASPQARVYLTAGVEQELLDLVDIWCLPWPSTYDGAAAEKVRARGGELWAYDNSLYSLDTADSSLLMRHFLWQLRQYDVRGVEWWAVSQWKSDPWTVPNQYAPQNGGGFFLYPSADRKGAPIDSIRWEMYREGVEDYDLLTMLRAHQDRVLAELQCQDQRLAGEAQMQELVSRVSVHIAEGRREANVADATRQEACRRIEFLQASPRALLARVSTPRGPAIVVQAEPGATVVVNGRTYGQGRAELAVPVGKTLSVTVKARGRSKSLDLQ